MSTVAEIKAAIATLTLEERAEVARCLHGWEDDEWDRQMAADTDPGGKLHRLMQQAEAEAQAGDLRDFPGQDQQ